MEMKQVSQNEKAGETVDRKFPIYLIVIISIIGVTIAGFVLYKTVYLPRSLLAVLPDPDLTGVEDQVAEEIRNRRLAVKKNPGSPDSWGKLGMILDVHDFKQEAIPCYKQGIALNPNEFRWFYFCAIVLNEIRSPGALDFFEKSNQLNRDYSPLHVRYGQALLNAGRLQNASQTFRRAISLDSTSSHAYLGLAKIAFSEARLQASLEFLNKALELNPEHREAHGMLADVLRRLRRTEEAAKEVQTARHLPQDLRLVDPVYEKLEAQGMSAVWYRDRGFALQAQGRLDAALEQFRKAMELKPDPEGHLHVGNLLSQLGRYGEAGSQYRTAISLAPNYVISYNNLGETLFKSGRAEEAMVWFEKCFRLDPQFPNAYLNLGAIHMQLDRPAAAIATFRRGLKNTGGFLPIVNRLAWLLATGPDPSLRNAREAVNLAKTACEKTKYSDPESLDILAAAYAESGDFKRAVALARKVHGLTVSSEQEELAKQIESRLNLYLAQKPYHSK